MKVPLLDLTCQYKSLQSQIEPAVMALMESQLFVLGKPVSELEKNLAKYHHCNAAVGMSSGTDALIASLMAFDIGPGDEVIVPTFTFFATAGCVHRVGATPVFVDIDADTFNMDLAAFEAAINSRTKAVIPVHLFGQMAPMADIMAIARKHNIKVIEDSCQSIGSVQNGNYTGQLGDCACLSFYPSKNLAGFGDGGMVLCNDEAYAQKLRYIRMHGEDKRYYHSMIGGNFRLDALQALVLDIKLPHLDKWVELRKRHAAIYDQMLCQEVTTPVIMPGNTSVYNQYVIRAPRRDELQMHLAENEIGSGVYYPVPLHLQECFKHLNGKPGDCPIAERACLEVLALPVYPELADEQIEYVAETINRFYQ